MRVALERAKRVLDDLAEAMTADLGANGASVLVHKVGVAEERVQEALDLLAYEDWEKRRDELAARILDAMDPVAFAASLDPDESGYGQPHAYSDEFRTLIREAQTLASEEPG